jgi:hypothetical protein
VPDANKQTATNKIAPIHRRSDAGRMSAQNIFWPPNNRGRDVCAPDRSAAPIANFPCRLAYGASAGWSPAKDGPAIGLASPLVRCRGKA